MINDHEFLNVHLQQGNIIICHFLHEIWSSHFAKDRDVLAALYKNVVLKTMQRHARKTYALSMILLSICKVNLLSEKKHMNSIQHIT